MRAKVPPRRKLPKPGDRIHSTGPYPSPGIVRAVLTEEVYGGRMHIIVVRYWFATKKRFVWDTVTENEWNIGLVMPGTLPKGATYIRVGE